MVHESRISVQVCVNLIYGKQTTRLAVLTGYNFTLEQELLLVPGWNKLSKVGSVKSRILPGGALYRSVGHLCKRAVLFYN